VVNRQHDDWEELATLDPYWAILSDPLKRFGGWNEEEFFRTGAREIDEVISAASELGHPLEFNKALDFGSGLGRLTRSLSSRFQECVGIDIAESMIDRAREINANWPNCRFVLNARSDLQDFPSNEFDFVYCNIVLQHLPSKALIRTYITEFIRVMKPGGLVIFQVLSFLPLKYRLQPTRRVYRLLRSVGFSASFVYRRLGLCPIRNNYIPRPEVLDHICSVGGDPLRSTEKNIEGLGIRSCTYYVTKKVDEGIKYRQKDSSP